MTCLVISAAIGGAVGVLAGLALIAALWLLAAFSFL
jgi:hypothetical protein